MRSLTINRTMAAGAAFALSGCLVSEVPLLDENTGRATPINNGVYTICPVSDDAGDDCNTFAVDSDETGLYRFIKDDEPDDATLMRFRRVGRGGYLVQSDESDENYAYYYGAGDSEFIRLQMMMCNELPERERQRLIDRGDMEVDDDNSDICILKSLRGARKAAKIYHRGKTVAPEDGDIIFEIEPASAQ